MTRSRLFFILVPLIKMKAPNQTNASWRDPHKLLTYQLLWCFCRAFQWKQKIEMTGEVKEVEKDGERWAALKKLKEELSRKWWGRISFSAGQTRWCFQFWLPAQSSEQLEMLKLNTSLLISSHQRYWGQTATWSLFNVNEMRN